MLNQIKKGAALERLRKQCPPKVYPRAKVEKVETQTEEKPFVPSRSLMYQRIKEETLKTKSVQDTLKGLPREERRAYIRNIIRSTIDDIRRKMTQEMEQHKRQEG